MLGELSNRRDTGFTDEGMHWGGGCDYWVRGMTALVSKGGYAGRIPGSLQINYGTSNYKCFQISWITPDNMSPCGLD